MLNHYFAARHFVHLGLVGAVATAGIVGVQQSASANGDIVAIEEHWELKVGEPNEEASGPQITMVMSPTYDLQCDYFMFTLNHHSSPGFAPGGMQVQHWTGDSLLTAANGPQEEMLSHNGETVTWVQRVTLQNSTLTYEVNSGASQSWGSFGNGGNLRITTSSSMTNLNDYRPAISLNDSGVNYGGNRVTSLTLTLLRWWDDQGNVYQYEAPIDVDADIDP